MKVENFSIASFAQSSFERVHTNELLISNQTSVNQTKVQSFSQDSQEMQDLDGLSLEPKYRQMLLALQRLLGKKIQITSFESDSYVSTPSTSGKISNEPIATYIQTQKESSSLELGFSGKVKTSEGKELEFSLSLSWHEEFSQRIDLISGQIMQDPLIISFDGMPPVLAEQFDFALTTNAQKLNYLSQNAAYLARDTNQNNLIDDGSELFGPKSGDGFAELANFDDDENGWIDSNDTIFKQLHLWKPNEEGGIVVNLEEIGIGAISLQSIETNFTSKKDINTPIANYKEASVVLGEDGNAYSLLSVDIAV
jgi:hypothetical protein